MIIWTKRFLQVLGLSAGVTLGCDSGTSPGPVDQQAEASPSETTGTPATQDPKDTPVVEDPQDPPVSEDPQDPPISEDPKDPPVTDDPEGAVARIDDNLERLQALELFEVGELMVMSPTAGGSCYGIPCPDEVEAVRAQLAEDLERLAALGENLKPGSESCDPALTADDAEAHLETLRNLHVVGVGNFLEVAPANNPMCYNLPCQEDIAQAEAANCEKVGRLGELATSAAAEFDVDAVKPPSGAIADVDENIRYLKALDVVEVGELLVGASVEVETCYVCPPETVEQDELMAATRLQGLRDIAEAQIADYRLADLEANADCDLSDYDADVAALAALKIIEVGALIEREPAAEGLCYFGACSDANYAEAHAMACRRAEALRTLVPLTWELSVLW